MVRTKKIYREHLLNGAYQLVINEGFKNFHARNVARQIQCSTQPIYREFSNLTEFKDSLCEFVINKIDNFFKKYPIDNIEALSQVISNYGKKYPKEFQRFFVEDIQCSQRIEEYIQSYFINVFIEASDAEPLDDEKADSIFKLFWYYAVGKTTLLANQERELPLCDNILVGLYQTYQKESI